MNGVYIDDYDMSTVADHCKLLFESGLINSYKPTRGGKLQKCYFILWESSQ